MPDDFDPYYRWLAIPPSEQPPHHYRLLGTQLFEADPGVIEAAADQRMAHLRQYQAGPHGPLSQRLLNEVAAARICLLKSEKKAAYDAALRERLKAQAKAAPRAPATEPDSESVLADLFTDDPAAIARVHPASRTGLHRSASAIHRGASPSPSAPPPLPMPHSQWKSRPVVLAAVGLLAVMLAVSLLALSGRKRTTSDRVSATKATETGRDRAIVVLEWPEDERQGAVLWVDGQQATIAAAGPLELTCVPGEYVLRLERAGYRQYVQKIAVVAGEQKAVRPVWESNSAAPATKGESAQETSGSQGKPQTAAVESLVDSANTKAAKTADPAATSDVKAASGGIAPPTPGPDMDAAKVSAAGGIATARPGPAVGAATQSASAASEAGGKAPTPSPEVQQALLAQADETFQLAKATTAAEKCKRATEIYESSRKYQSHPNEEFVLLRRAMELAAQGGDADLMLAIIDAIAERFDIVPLVVKRNMLRTFADTAHDPARLDAVIKHSTTLIQQAIAEERYEIGQSLADQAYALAIRSTRAKAQRKLASDQRQLVAQAQKTWQEFLAAEKTLQLKPDDPAASLIVGRWYCLQRGDWERGLPCLARSSDSRLSELARREAAAAGASADDQVKLADAWWDLADTFTGSAKDRIRVHAADWYGRALPNVALELAKTRIKSRMNSVASQRTRADRPAGLAAQTSSGGKLAADTSDVLGPLALVAAPTPLRSVQTWTIETIFPRGAVQCVAYSPDGRMAAGAGVDAVIRIWQRGGALSQVLLGHEDVVWRIAFSPNSRMLASASSDGSARVWDVQTGRAIKRLSANEYGVSWVDWSPDGRNLAVAQGRTVCLWDAVEGKMIYALQGHTAWVTCVAWSPDGKTVASGSDRPDATIRLWDPGRGQVNRVLEGDGNRISSVAWSPDGKTLASFGIGARFWDLATGQHRSTPNTPGPIVVWSPNGKLAATGGDERIRLWDANSGAIVREVMTGGSSSKPALAWSPDGREILAGDLLGGIWAWDIEKGVPVSARSKQPPVDMSAVAAWSRDGTKIAASIRDYATVWDLGSGQCVSVLNCGGVVRGLDWSPDGRILAVATSADVVQLWDPASRQALGKLFADTVDVERVVWAPTGARLAAASSNRLIRIWDTASSKVLQVLNNERLDFRNALAWSPDGKRLACGGEKIRVFDAVSGNLLQTIPCGWSSGLSWSPDAKTLAFADGRRIVVVDPTGARPMVTLSDKNSSTAVLAWSPDSKTLLSADDAGATYWDVAAVKAIRTHSWRRLLRSVGPAAISADQKYLAVRRNDGVMRIVDVESGQSVRVLAHLNEKQFACFAPEGHYRASPDVEPLLVYVVTSAEGQKVFAGEEFFKRFRWRNAPQNVAWHSLRAKPASH